MRDRIKQIIWGAKESSEHVLDAEDYWEVSRPDPSEKPSLHVLADAEQLYEMRKRDEGAEVVDFTIELDDRCIRLSTSSLALNKDNDYLFYRGANGFDRIYILLK